MNPNLPQVEADNNTLLFLEGLVLAITGYSISEIPVQQSPQIIQDCINCFVTFVIEFSENKFGKKEAIRLRAAQQFAGEDIFSKFNELGHVFDEAFDAFINLLKQDLATVKISN